MFSHFKPRDATPENFFFSNLVSPTCIHLTVYVCIIHVRQKANSLKNITWSVLQKQNIQGKKVYNFEEKMFWNHTEACSVFSSAATRNKLCYWTIIGKAISAGFKTQDFQARFQALSGKGLHSFKIFSCYFALFSCYCNT